MDEAHLQKAARRGEPSYVWRAGQERRLGMILKAAGGRENGHILEDGCGVGAYLNRLKAAARQAVGLEIDHPRAIEAQASGAQVVCGAGERLPFPDEWFDLVLSHEVLEHVNDDALSVQEIVRILKPGGRLVLFCPNLGYPFETHGIYWRGKYRFGNIPLVNYLPRPWRNQLAPHVRIYTQSDMEKLFYALPVTFIERRIIFGAYDNLIVRFGSLGRLLRSILQGIESTPLQWFGLSHFWVVEKKS